MDSLKWVVGCIPMFTDDQRLFTRNKEFGPLAHILPAPGDGLKRIQDFDVPLEKSILVGLILVDTNAAPLPDTYEALYLRPGFSCVYFNHTGEDPFDGWHAYVTRLLAIRSVDYCAKPTVELRRQALRVIPYHDSTFRSESDYPLIARFRETTSGGRNHWPMFGLKCVAAFCIVSPDLGNANPHKSEHVGFKKSVRTWQVFGWNDEQHPAVGNGIAKAQWDFNASIIAVPNLGGLKIADFNKDTVHVATVYLKNAPPKKSKYDTLWHYKQGENFILLHHDSAAGRDNGWSGVLRHSLAPPTMLDKLLAMIGFPYEWPLHVNRMDHSGVSVLGTARFKWSPNDDNDWARCDAGCCEVTPGLTRS